MRILIQSRAASQISLIAQLAAEWRGRHHAAVVRRQRRDHALLEQDGIPVYDLKRIIEQGRTTTDRVWSQLDAAGPQEAEYAGIRLWDVSQYERLWAEQRGVDRPNLLKDTLGEVLALEAVLGDFQPDVVLVWNGIPSEMRISRELARRAGAGAFCMERGLLPDSMTIDPLGVNAQSILCTDEWDRVVANPPGDNVIRQVRDYLDAVHAEGRSVVSQAGRCSPAELRERLGVSSETRLLLVPEQIDSDTNILYNASQYPTNRGVIESLIRTSERIAPCSILFKPHPETTTPLAAEEVLGEHGHVISDVNVNSLIHAADAVVVRNSTVGLESAGYDKPVVVLGKAAWSHKGFTYDVPSPDRIAETLNKALTDGFTPAMRRAADIFFAHLAERRHYFLKGREPFPGANTSILAEIESAAPAAPVRYRADAPMRAAVKRYQRFDKIERIVRRTKVLGAVRRAANAVRRTVKQESG